METFEVGDRVVFREDESTEDTKGTVTARVHEDLGLEEPAYTVELDEERDGATQWTVAHHELTKTGYVSLDTLLEGE